ncbi:MAG: hypothetical protein S4CHLAM102_15070 [Chlamydiia bacterium]|nr:hypothetical protein [Chlamydiia bacterium]
MAMLSVGRPTAPLVSLKALKGVVAIEASHFQLTFSQLNAEEQEELVGKALPALPKAMGVWMACQYLPWALGIEREHVRAEGPGEGLHEILARILDQPTYVAATAGLRGPFGQKALQIIDVAIKMAYRMPARPLVELPTDNSGVLDPIYRDVTIEMAKRGHSSFVLEAIIRMKDQQMQESCFDAALKANQFGTVYRIFCSGRFQKRAYGVALAFIEGNKMGYIPDLLRMIPGHMHDDVWQKVAWKEARLGDREKSSQAIDRIRSSSMKFETQLRRVLLLESAGVEKVAVRFQKKVPRDRLSAYVAERAYNLASLREYEESIRLIGEVDKPYAVAKSIILTKLKANQVRVIRRYAKLITCQEQMDEAIQPKCLELAINQPELALQLAPLLGREAKIVLEAVIRDHALLRIVKEKGRRWEWVEATRLVRQITDGDLRLEASRSLLEQI